MAEHIRNCAGGVVFAGDDVFLLKNDKGEWIMPKGVIPRTKVMATKRANNTKSRYLDVVVDGFILITSCCCSRQIRDTAQICAYYYTLFSPFKSIRNTNFGKLLFTLPDLLSTSCNPLPMSL